MNEFKGALALSLALAACAAPAATIRVPRDVATIQGAIAAARAGDTVLVSPGTYDENIDFLGKAIAVQSAQGPATTIIDGGQRDSVVIFHAGEGRNSVLKGFTLRNGNAAQFPLDGGGVNVVQTSPTIEGNWITGNSACSGNGVGLYFSGALVKNNRIYGNYQNGCGGGTLGGGIHIGGTGGAQVVGNLIEKNRTDMGGGGIGMNGASDVQIMRNIVRGNSAGSWGGGVALINDSRPNFADNLVYSNTAPQGGGLYLLPPFGSTGGTWINNTVADNTARIGGSELYTNGFAEQVQFVNNIFRASQRSSAIYCDSTYSASPPVFITNDLFTTNGTLAEGVCAGILNQGGNVSVDPLFVAGRNSAAAYRLQAGSPAVDAGTPNALAGKRDLSGRPRLVDGNGDGTAAVDLGAHEYGPP